MRLRQAPGRVTVAVCPHDRRFFKASRQDCFHAADRPPVFPQVSGPTTLLAHVLACRAVWHSQDVATLSLAKLDVRFGVTKSLR